MSSKNILFLGVDGILNKLPNKIWRPDRFSFLDWAKEHFEVMWLTSRRESVFEIFDRKTYPFFAANWEFEKHEVLQRYLDSNWYWAESDPSLKDTLWLVKNRMIRHWVYANPESESTLVIIQKQLEYVLCEKSEI